MRLLGFPSQLLFLTFAAALPAPQAEPQPLPLIIWHGLGDRYDADGLQSTGALAQKIHPGTFVYYVRTDEDGGTDRTNTFFGNVSTQIEEVCEAMRSDDRVALELRMDVWLMLCALGFALAWM